jgi:hypothetical protein
MKRFLIAMMLAMFAAPALAGTAPNYSPPLGFWRMPAEMLGNSAYNLTGLAFDPSTNKAADVMAALDQARAAHAHIFVSLVNWGQLKEDPPGNFQLSIWQGRYNAWCPQGHCLALDSYVQDGTLIGLHIFEYSKPPMLGARLSPDLDQIHQVATYVKTLWPNVPTIIDTSKPCVFTGQNWSHAVDILLFTTFTQRWSDFSRGEDVINRGVTCTKQAGLKFMLDPNPFGGTQAQDGMPPDTLPNFVHFAEFSIRYPGSLGTAIWRWWPSSDNGTQNNGRKQFLNLWSEQVDPGIGAAMKEIQTCAAQRTAAACPHS